jgi:dihydrofolate reductase
MRKLKLQVQISVDGYIATTDGKTGWLIWNWGPVWNWDDDLRKYFIGLTASVDCVLLSRKMAEEGFIDHWAKCAESPDDPQYAFASKIAAAQKVVFSKTLHKSIWKNTRMAGDTLAGEINQIKNSPGKDIIVYGGASFVSALIKAKLIDEFHLFVNPAILGKGMTIFSELGNKQNLALIKSVAYDCGVAVLVYAPKKD